MSIKTKLLEEIDKKAEDIKEKRKIAAEEKNTHTYVFEFFRRLDEIKHHPVMMGFAIVSLEENMRTIDPGCKVKIEFSNKDDLTVRGVTIYWSSIRQKNMKCEASLYIDIGEMLLI